MDKAVGVLERSRMIVQEVLASLPTGMSVAGCAAATGLPRTTVHRLVTDLESVGILARSGKVWVLGPGARTLAAHAPMEFPDVSRLRRPAQQLADVSSFSVYVTVMSFGRCYYLLRADGDTPIRIFNVEVGEYKRFGESFAGVALLSTLSRTRQDNEIATIYASPPPFLDATPEQHTASIRDLLGQMDSAGWCGGSGWVHGVAGMACVVPGPEPRFAVTISGVESLLDDAKRSALAPAMLECAEQLVDVIGLVR
ncbi:IclR family transcriptional regulator [Corynebacterium auris]|uniref:IclR family transcriptional regulator n=1 Tax=Corynebacterium auris TaxID=44750 RepID=UPI0025B32BE5|nr:helix-turn-helix domain-containing protein [Corynebacterium auris]WJY68795.1 IclR helix-turn-helix domain protein [Corynebacterium auris]